MKEFIQEICEAVGPRISGSPQEAQAARLIAARLEVASDEVGIEEVPIHIGVAPALTTLLVGGVLVALVLYWFVPLLAVLLIPLVLLVLYLSRPRGKDVIDFLFPKGMTQNVVAKLHPTGPTKRRVILSGHHDSAPVARIFSGPFSIRLARPKPVTLRYFMVQSPHASCPVTSLAPVMT